MSAQDVHVRVVSVWCGQWPAVASGAAAGDLVGIVDAGRVVAATPAALATGVTPGQRRRQAQARCAALELRPLDARQVATAFAPVVAAVSSLTPRVEVPYPGSCHFDARGPTRYFGGEDALAQRVATVVDGVLADRGWPGWSRVGLADGPTTAGVVARHLAAPVEVVPPGGAAARLADLPVACVLGDQPGVASLLGRLGVDTVGAFAALGPVEVLGRFGSGVATAHAVARGVDPGALGAGDPPPELVVTEVFDPPVERADAVAFAVRDAAERFCAHLRHRGVTTANVTVALGTAHGEEDRGQWHYDGSPKGLVDRVRWQLERWLSGPSAQRPTAGVTHARFIPDAVVADTGTQPGFWGGQSDADRQATRAMARLVSLTGAGQVLVPRVAGGRGPGEQVVRVPVGTPGPGATPATAPGWVPWPGAVPPPPPALVHDPPLPIEVVDAQGQLLGVDGRGHLSAPPQRAGPPGRLTGVVDWAGPWPVDERWWDPVAHRRRARLQLCCHGGPPLLVACEGGRWWCEGTYD